MAAGYCPGCGAQASDGDRFCKGCGGPLASVEPSDPPRGLGRPEGRPSQVRYAVIALLVVVVFAVGLYAVGRGAPLRVGDWVYQESLDDQGDVAELLYFVPSRDPSSGISGFAITCWPSDGTLQVVVRHDTIPAPKAGLRYRLGGSEPTDTTAWTADGMTYWDVSQDQLTALGIGGSVAIRLSEQPAGRVLSEAWQGLVGSAQVTRELRDCADGFGAR